MRPLPEYERLHRQLEQDLLYKHGKEQLDQSQSPVSTIQNDPEIDTLVALACRVQQVHAGFAQQLEVRILSHHIALCQQLPKGARQVAKKQRSWLFSRSFRASIVAAVALLCLLLGTSLLALAAPITNPSNPLYAVKKWEQHVQLSLAHSPLNQAKVSPQIARDRLNTLANAHRNHISQNIGNNGGNRFGNNNGGEQNGNEQGGKSHNGDTNSHNEGSNSNNDSNHVHK